MNVVLLFEPSRAEALRAFLAAGGFAFGERPHAAFFAKRERVSLTAYASGKLLLTGEQAEEFAGVLQGRGLARAASGLPSSSGKVETGVSSRPRLGAVTVTPEAAAGGGAASFTPHAGSDESGKGDYFGPLAVATVFVPDAATARALREAGVADSKTIGLGRVGPLAALIRQRCPHAIVVLPPATYNDMYARVKNLNDLLAWAHARAIEDLLATTGTVPIIVDQFARGVLRRHLMERGRNARITEVVRGEADVAVAAASLVARAEFLAGLAQLETRFGRPLPRGAGPPVVKAAREIVATAGAAHLREVAKLHFATTSGATGAKTTGDAPPDP